MTHNQEWFIEEKDITSEVCQKCGLCCEIEYGVPDRLFEWVDVVVEDYDHIERTKKGIRIRCSHLEETADGLVSCNIYETRPKLCKDYNCVSWAKSSDDLTQYNRVLVKLELSPMLKWFSQQPESEGRL